MASIPDEKPESKLCDKCAVLRINDESFGYYDSTKDSVHPVLTYRVGYVGSGSERKYHSGRRFKLDYQRHDRLPLLPLLTEDAKHCDFCSALRDATLKLAGEGPCGIHYNSMYYERWKLDSGKVGLRKLCVVAEVRYDAEALRNVTHTLNFLVDATDQCMDWLQTPERPSDEALSNKNLAWLKQQLHHCDEDCGPFPASDFCPTRLIDLLLEGDNDTVRLVEARRVNVFPTPRYAALSYCWGNKEDALTQLKTTTRNLAQHLEKIPSDTMTPVVKDAIQTCRLLGIRYLWVDALCILQDDGDDWAREAVQMGSVYTNAYVTICTPATSSCRDSFLRRAAPVRVKFESTVRPGVNGFLNLRLQPTQELYCMHGSTFECDMNVGTWGTRAWTFQEEQLSKRRLYFGATRMYLSCPKRTLTEPALSREAAAVHFHDALKEFKNVTEFGRLYDMWIELIKDYASRELTYEHDRFPAIAGLAGLIAGITGDEYVAGLWREDLIRGLLWSEGGHLERDLMVSRRSIALSSITEYACPSWSWAAGTKPKYERLSSLACGPNPIREEEWELQSQCKSITACCESENPALNRFGRIRAAKLQVEGKLLAVGKDWRHLDKQRSTMNQWKCAISDECVATYDLDWVVQGQENYWTVGGVKKSLDVENIQMLLLASTTGGDWSWESNHYTPIASPTNSDLENSDSEDGEDDGGQDDDEDRTLEVSSKRTILDESKLIEPEQTPSRNEYPIPNVSSQTTENGTANRHAWGLLVLPMEGSNTFIRAGRFKIWAQMGGLKAFKNCLFQHVEII